jgi:hypothetical protein
VVRVKLVRAGQGMLGWGRVGKVQYDRVGTVRQSRVVAVGQVRVGSGVGWIW